MQVGRHRTNRAPTISSNSGCGNQDGPTLAEVQDGSTIEYQSCPVPSETHDLGSAMSQRVKHQVARLYKNFKPVATIFFPIIIFYF